MLVIFIRIAVKNIENKKKNNTNKIKLEKKFKYI